MAISYPLTPPATPGYRSTRFRGRSVVATSRSPFTLTQEVQVYDGQTWEADLVLPPMRRPQAEAWIAFLLALNGREGTFLLGDPDGATARGVATGTPVVDGIGQSGRTLATRGWTPSTTGILKAGDYIQLGSGASARLHKVLTDAASDGTGDAVLDIFPRLRSSPADGAAISVSNCVGLFRLADNLSGWDADQVSLYGLSFSAEEAI